jgi:fumarylacetoacetase
MDRDDVSGWGIDHLPWGTVVVAGRTTLAVRLGATVLDVAAAARAGLLPTWLDLAGLDGLLARRAGDWGAAREAVRGLLLSGHEGHLHDLAAVEALLPFTVADYVDFYASEAHATRVGRLLRPDGDPLLPNWRHVPVGYHGRAGTVVVDGTPVTRPTGVRWVPGGAGLGPTARLDLELELGFVVGGPATTLGAAVAIDAVEDHLFGVVLLDDWSARDVQAFESQPLGPFLGKSFATSIGAWVTPLEALQDAKVAGPVQRDPLPSEHLQVVGHWGLDLDLRATLSTAASRADGLEPATIVRSSSRDLYWTPAQLLAHLTVNGATLRPGDLLGSGTVSGWSDDAAGCLLERTAGGTEPLELPWGERRTWLEDGDEVVLHGGTPDGRVALAPVRGRVGPGEPAAAR